MPLLTNQTMVPLNMESVDVPSLYLTPAGNLELKKALGLVGYKARRPSNIDFATNQYNFSGNLERANWLILNVSIFSTIVLRTVKETLRYGLEWEERFVRKCEECGEEHQEHVLECSCGAKGTRPVNPIQKNLFKRPFIENEKRVSFMEVANNNGKSLKELCKAFIEQSLVYNNPYILANCEYTIDEENGEILKRTPIEFIQLDPLKTRIIFDKSGTPGDGTGFTISDRHSLYDIEEMGGYVDGQKLYPAHWAVSETYGNSGKQTYYTEGEIYHATPFGESLNYGYPPCLHAHDALMTYFHIEKRNAKELEKGHPRALLLLSGATPEVASSFRSGIEGLMEDDPYAMPVLSLTPSMTASGRAVEYVPFSQEPYSERVGLKNEIRDRICALMGVPNLFVSDVSASGGMNNESQQITVFDRYLDDVRQSVNDMLKWVFTFFPDLTDYRIIVSCGSSKNPDDDIPESQKRLMYVQEAQQLKSVGFEVLSYDGETGKFQYSSEPKKEDPGMDMMSMFGGGYMGSGSSFVPLEGDIRKSSQAWRKSVPEEVWQKYLIKDAYTFLRSNKEEILSMIMLGHGIKDDFKSINADGVRDVYKIIIKELMNPMWSKRLMVGELRERYPQLNEAQAETIIRTELGRIINHTRELYYHKTYSNNQLYTWDNPEDERTSPTCKEIIRRVREEGKGKGVPLLRLKEIVREEGMKWASEHKLLYLSDWQPHINCRSTYFPTSFTTADQEGTLPTNEGSRLNISDSERDAEVDYYRYNPDLTEEVFDVGGTLSMSGDGVTSAVTVVLPIPQLQTSYRLGFITPKSSPMVTTGSAPLFVFQTLTPAEVGKASQLITSVHSSGVPYAIKEAMLREAFPKITQVEASFIIANAEGLYQEMLIRGEISL